MLAVIFYGKEPLIHTRQMAFNMHAIKKYLKLYANILQMAIKLLLEYRFNVFVQSIFAIVYFVGIWFLLQVVFSKTQTLGGWRQPELMLLLGVSSSIWGVIDMTFFEGLHQFMVSGIRTGDLDRFLTKPVNPAFSVAFFYPQVGLLPNFFTVFLFMIYWAIKDQAEITPISIGLFLIVTTFCFAISYFLYSSYATTAFHVTRSDQVLRLIQTLNDHSQYPTIIYPKFIEFTLTFVMPNAFIGYIPTVFLLNKGNVPLFLIVVIFTFISYGIYHFAWRFGLKKYTSASS